MAAALAGQEFKLANRLKAERGTQWITLLLEGKNFVDGLQKNVARPEALEYEI